MKRKALLLILSAALLACGCSISPSSKGNETTVPLDSVIQAIRTGDTAVYLSAFPASFCAQYLQAHPDMGDTVDLLLTVAREFELDRYGEDAVLWYELDGSIPYELTRLQGELTYAWLDSFSYTLPTEQITQALTLSVTVHLEGSYESATYGMELTVLYMNGQWLLHPDAFGTVLHPSAGET